jgi:hypothetical protein
MVPINRLLRNLFQRLRGTYYEGPEAPSRLGQIVEVFAASRRRATRRQWIEFARSLAEEAYRSGYVRGYEWAERDLDRRDPAIDPEALAAVEGHEWEWLDGGSVPTPEGLDEVVGEGDPAADLADELREIEDG